MPSIDWSAEMSRGALTYGVLLTLRHGPRHGYEIRALLRDDAAFARLQGGTLYPLLRRLEDQGLLAHRWDTSGSGPARKMHELTPHGQVELGRARDAWRGLAARLDELDHLT